MQLSQKSATAKCACFNWISIHHQRKIAHCDLYARALNTSKVYQPRTKIHRAKISVSLTTPEKQKSSKQNYQPATINFLPVRREGGLVEKRLRQNQRRPYCVKRRTFARTESVTYTNRSWCWWLGLAAMGPPRSKPHKSTHDRRQWRRRWEIPNRRGANETNVGRRECRRRTSVEFWERSFDFGSLAAAAVPCMVKARSALCCTLTLSSLLTLRCCGSFTVDVVDDDRQRSTIVLAL